MLAGVGVPDVRGSQSRGTFYTQDATSVAQENEQLIFLDSGDEIATRVLGPRNTKASPVADTSCEVRVQVDKAACKLVVHTGGSPARIEVPERSWSEWLRFKFRFSMLQSVMGIARLYVRQLEPRLEFYVSAVNFDPAAPMFPVSAPADYARELADKVGLFSTLGMAEDHNGLNNGRLDEAAYLQQCELVLGDRERTMRFELDRFAEGFFFILFDTPDRVQHMLWRFRDREHPGFEADLSPELAGRIEQHYSRCDALLSAVLDKVDENTLLIVLSDHGFATWRRSVNYDSWLVEKGYLVLRGNAQRQNLEALFSRGAFWEAVDWSKSRAYAMGLGDVYVNLRGREKDGIVAPGADYEKLRDELSRGLLELTDPKTGEHAVSRVFKRENVYRRYDPRLIPDLIVANRPGYRVSWQASLGVPTDTVFEDNRDVWSGDHCSLDPDLVRGVLFASKAFRAAPIPGIADVTASIRQLIGAAAPPDAAGKSLW